MKRLMDQRLYSDNDYALKALDEGIDLEAEGFYDHETSAKQNIIYHCYYYGEIGRKQVLSIKSFLCTQDLAQCKIILWLDSNNGFKTHEQNFFLKPLLPLIEIKEYDPVYEVKGTLWENNVEIPNENKNLQRRSDAFRFLILHKYGGVYFDLDVLFLKDLNGLVHTEFCYAWENQSFANSAVFNLHQESDISIYLLKKAIQKGSALPWKIFNYDDVLLVDLFLLPCAFFDPLWQPLLSKNFPIDDYTNFFKPFGTHFENHFHIQSYKNFFPGCYTFHWHGRAEIREHENSFFGIFEHEFSELLNIEHSFTKQVL